MENGLPMGKVATRPTDHNSVAGIMLSNEELVVLLRLLHARNIPGFDPSWAYVPGSDSLSAQGSAMLDPALRALIARGVVEVDSGAPGGSPPRVTIGAFALALVGICTRSSINIRVFSRSENEVGEFYLSDFEGLGTLHVVMPTGIHAFLPVAGRKGMLDAVLALASLDIDQTQVEIVPPQRICVDVSTLRHAFERSLPVDRAWAKVESSTMTLPTNVVSDVIDALYNWTRYTEITVGVVGPDGSISGSTAVCLIAPTSNCSFALDQDMKTMRLLTTSGGQGLKEWLSAELAA